MKRIKQLLGLLTLVCLGLCAQPAMAQDLTLLKTHWYQDGPFAAFTPNHERLGCWSTAYSQILFYHRLKPHGRVTYECSNGYKVDVDLDQVRFDWDQLPDAITTDTPRTAAEKAARYCFAAAAVVQKDFGTDGYKRLLNSVNDLQAHYDVEAKIYVSLANRKLPMDAATLAAKLKSEEISNLIDHAQIEQMLTTELAARRPVYFHFGNLKDFGHSTVIDGLRQEGGRCMVHINYGHADTDQNRWYELFAPIAQPDDDNLRAFVTVKPRRASTAGTEIEQLLNRTLPPLLAQHHVPAAAVAVIRNGELVATVVAGEQENGIPATRQTLFNVASLTKPVAAHAFLRLINNDRLKLDEPLSPYWIDPDIKTDPRHQKLTARIVLSHQTGFPNWRDGKPLGFNFEPGQRTGYSGEGYEYLRRAVEAKTHRSLVELVSETTLVPYAMSDTHLVWDPSFDGRFAREHDKNGRRIDVPTKSIACAADDLLTTIGDYGRFAAGIVRGANLSPELFKQVCTLQATLPATNDAKGPTDFGLCWRILKTSRGTALAHGGSDLGVRAGVMLVLESKSGVVVFTNGDNGGRIIEAVVPLVVPDGKEYLDHYIGR